MRNLKTEFISYSLIDTENFAFAFTKNLQKGAVVALFGEVGSGKTTFLKSAISSLGGITQDNIESPTFTYLNIYSGNKLSLYHFDLYRLKSSSDFIHLGFKEFFEDCEGFSFLEWSEKIVDLLPSHTIKVFLSHEGKSSRKFKVEYPP